MWNVDLKKLGVDFTQLIDFRNSVAHKERLQDTPTEDKDELFNLFQNARHALRLVLLQILEYHDLVIVNENGWKANKNMNEALSGKYGAVY